MADIYDIAASGMSAQRTQMDVIAANLANADLPRADGNVFRAKTAVLEQSSDFGSLLNNTIVSDLDQEQGFGDDSGLSGNGVQVAGIIERPQSVAYRFDPGNPFAARTGQHKGYVALPDVDPIQQMVDLVSAGRAYDADVSVMSAAKQMDIEAADIDRA